MSSSRKYCPFCGCFGTTIKWGLNKQKRTRYCCKECRKTFCSRTGTIRSKSHLTEKQWNSLPKLVSLRTHPSGADLGRYFGKSVRTGQRVMKNIREILPSSSPPQAIKSLAELDETTFKGQWIGGGKQRKGRVSLIPLKNRGTRAMNEFVEKLVAPKVPIFTDEWRGYNEIYLSRDHLTVCHAREFVSEHCKVVHTNGIEGVWGHAKPLAVHTYRGYPKIEDFLREICFQFNFTYTQRCQYLTAHFSRLLKSTNTLCR